MSYNLEIGDDLNYRDLRLSIPDGTTFSGKRIVAATSAGRYIVEGEVSGNYLAGITKKANWSVASDFETVFYRTAQDINLRRVVLGGNVGTIISIDKEAVIYPYIERMLNEKAYLISEDLQKFDYRDFFADRIVGENTYTVNTESGKSAEWHVIRYESGNAMVWTEVEYTSAAPLVITDTASGVGNYGRDEIPYPKYPVQGVTEILYMDLFDSAPIVFLTTRQTPFYWCASVLNNDDEKVKYTISTWKPDNLNGYVGHVYIYAIGRWK